MENGFFTRIWRFIDKFSAQDKVRRQDLDTALDDLAGGINDAKTFTDDYVGDVEAARDEAQTAATEAGGSATTATEKAGLAAEAETTATEKATEASDSADAAAQSATDASDKATEVETNLDKVVEHTADAEVAATTATGAATSATETLSQTEAARDAAIMGVAGIFDTEVKALSNTNDTDTFVIAGSDGWTLYQNDAGTADPLSGTYPSLTKLVQEITAAQEAIEVRQDRPGELATRYTAAKGGDRTGAPVSGSVATVDDYGSVLQVGHGTIIALRDRVWIDSARPATVRAIFRVQANTSDPEGEAVFVGVEWLDKNYASVGSSNFHSVVVWESDGWQDISGLVGGDLTPPAGAVYFAPYFQVGGTDGSWDVAHLGVEQEPATIPDVPVNKLPNIPASLLPVIPYDKLPDDDEYSVARTLFVSQGGDNANNGENLSRAVRDIEAARDLAAASGEPTAIHVYPGDYVTSGHIDVPDNVTGIVAATNSRSTKIKPSAGDEVKNVFRLGDGGYVEGFSFEGWQVDDLDDPSEGFAVSFRPGAIIRRTVFAFNITVFRGAPATLMPPPLDRENGNPLVGNGPGVSLADKSVVSQYSPFPQIMLWGATPVSPNGIGYCAKNGAFLNGINAVALWMHKHYLALSGGEIILTNCASQFGDYSLSAEGSTQEVVPATTGATLVTDTAAADAVSANASTIIDQMWSDLQGNGYGTLDEAATRKDAGLFLSAIEYDLRAGQQESSRRFAKGMFDYAGNFVAPAAPVVGFTYAWESMRDQIKALGPVSATAGIMIDGLVALMVSTVETPEKIAKPSRIKSVGHQWSGVMAGVNGRALDRPTLDVPASIVERDLGEVIYAGIDDLGKQYFAGGVVVNPLTGRLEGPPIARTIDPRAFAAATIVGGQQ